MGASPIPLPQANTDAAAQTLQQLLTARQPLATGSISSGTQIPQPQPIGTPMPMAPGGGAAQGHFADKGEHKRASMQSLAASTQNLVAQVHNAYEARENKQLGQKFSTLIGSQKGMQAADEQIKNAQTVLQSDPDNAQAKQMLSDAQSMKQHNITVLNQLLDPTTPEGKKNIKLFNKGFGFDDKNADTPERAAAIQAMRSQTQNTTTPSSPATQHPGGAMGQPGPTMPATQGQPVAQASSGLNEGAAGLLSRFPQGIGMSPQTQVSAQMVQAGVTPKAATQGQIMANQNTAAKTVTTQEEKAAQQKIQRDRLGLDDHDQPIPLDQLPVATRAKIDEERAGDALKSSQTAYTDARAKALSDPTNPAYKIAALRAQGTMENAEARMIMAHTGQLNYEMHAMGTGPDGKPLNASLILNGQPVGTAFAAALQRALPIQAQFKDVKGATTKLDAAGQDMSNAGYSFNDPRLVKVLSDPNFKAADSTWFHNQLNSATIQMMPPEMQTYLVQQRQHIENLTALRGMLKSPTAQAQIERMINTAPGAQTPNYDYFQKQMTALYGQLDRLQSGVPEMNMGTPQPQYTPSKPNVPTKGGGGFDASQYPVVQ
jgi:hypothetical protein